MTGDGIVSAGKKAVILLEKDFTNTGRLEAGSSLSLAVKGNITNRKEILSRGDVYKRQSLFLVINSLACAWRCLPCLPSSCFPSGAISLSKWNR